MPIAISSVSYRYDEITWTIIMTVLFFPLLVEGSNATLPITNAESTVAMPTTFISTTASQDTDAIYLWIPLIIVVIFAVIVTTLIIIGRQTRRASCKCLGVPSSLDSTPDESVVTNPRRTLTLNINLPVNSTDPIVPETPPPSYAVIARQISSISTISQTSSQIEIPPGYDEAIDIPDGTDRRPKRRVSQQPSARGSVSSQTQVPRPSSASRFRLFSRSSSSSASESSRRPPLLRQTSTPQEFRSLGLPAADTVPELPELEHAEAALGPAILDIIHEFSTATEDIRLDNHAENNGVSRFYIDETDINNESMS